MGYTLFTQVGILHPTDVGKDRAQASVVANGLVQLLRSWMLSWSGDAGGTVHVSPDLVPGLIQFRPSVIPVDCEHSIILLFWKQHDGR